MFQRVSNFLQSGTATLLPRTPVSIVLALLVLGLSGVVATWNLALGVAAAIWLGLITAIGLYWMRHLRAAFPGARWVFSACFAVLLICFVIGATVVGTTSNLSRTTTQIRLEVQTGDPNQPGSSPSERPATMDPWFLNTECGVMTSATLLEKVVSHHDLSAALSRELGRHLRPETVLEFLKHRLQIKALEDKNLLELRVSAPSERESSQIADVIFTVYERDLKERQRSAAGRERIHAAVESKTTITASSQARFLSGMVPGGMFCFWIACVACAGAAFGAWLHDPRGHRFAAFMPALLVLVVLLLVVLALAFNTSDARYWTSARVRLVAGDGTSDPATWAADAGLYDRSALADECARLSSPQFRTQVLLVHPEAPDTIQIEAVHVPRTSLVDIWVNAGDAKMAAAIANTAARIFCSSPLSDHRRAESLDPAARAHRANQSPLGEALGQATAFLLPFALGTGAAWIGVLLSRFRQEKRSRLHSVSALEPASEASET